MTGSDVVEKDEDLLDVFLRLHLLTGFSVRARIRRTPGSSFRAMAGLGGTAVQAIVIYPGRGRPASSPSFRLCRRVL